MMEDKTKVTVIIPCYNHGKSIDKAVNSVLNQTFQDFEIIIINDGSTDKKTNEILSNYAKPKTRVIQISNQGPSIARNTGIKEAKGEYILPLDADDTIENTYLEKAVKILNEDDDVSIVCCNFKGILNYILFKRISYIYINYKFPECLLFRNKYLFTVASFFRKSDWEKVGGFNENMIYGWEDYDFWISIIELGKKVYHIPEFLFNYNGNRFSKSRDSLMTIEKHKESYLTMFHNHEKLFLDNIEIFFKHSVDLTFNNIKGKTMNKRLLYFIIFTYVVVFLSIIFMNIKG